MSLNGQPCGDGTFSRSLLTMIIMVINQKFFISGFTGLLHGAPNMDTLVALGARGGIVRLQRLCTVCHVLAAQVRGDMDAVMAYMHEGLNFRVRSHDPGTHHRRKNA